MTPLHGFDTARLDRLGTWMERYVDERKYPGSSVLLHRHGEEVYHHACGMRDIEKALPFERDTAARIYSMTKPITSVAIMMLAERGLFHLDAPVSDFLPEFAQMRALKPGATSIDDTEPCATPNLQQLLTHTSGLSYPFNPGVLPREMEAQGIIFRADDAVLEETTKRLAALPLAFKPGTKWEYSVSIDVLGRIVEVVSGKDLRTFFREEIFAPLGMEETDFHVPATCRDRFAALYTPLSGNPMELNAAKGDSDTLRCVDRPEKSIFLEPTLYSGGGGLISTLDDYMKFVEMLRRGGMADGGRLLSPNTLKFMMRNHLDGDIAAMGPSSFAEQPMRGTGFGLGGSVVLDPGRVGVPGSVGDFSWGGMASTFFWIDPVLDLTAVFFTQLTPSSSYPSRAEMKAIVHGALVA
ncbi:serine hydrolase domain-containing protein [Litorivita pollutaquae]|nr:serine hydrolase domain-containing protein [Litorivita pollutaquae]